MYYSKIANAALLCAFSFAAVFCPTASLAWSDKPIKILIPAPPGGSIDVIARQLIEQMAADAGITAVVDYKPGAGGAIAVKALLAAPSDGRTIMMTSSNVLTEIPHVMKTGFDPLKDIRPVAVVGRGSIVLVASPNLPVQDLKDFVSYAKANTGKLTFASYSTGTASHYAGMIFNQKAGLDLQHVPFAGSPPALVQLIGGQVSIMFDGMATSLPQIKAGKIKALGVASATRSAHLPQTPTLTEQGFPEIQYGGWFGVIVGAGMPNELVEKIHAAVSKAATAPRFVERLTASGFDAAPAMTPAALAGLVKSDFERNALTVKTFNIRLD